LTNSKLYDITRRALDNSRKTQGYLESFIMEAKIGVLVIDDGGMVLIANHEAENYLHIQYKDIMGKNAFDILGASQWRGQRLAQAFTSCLADKSSLQYSHPLEDDPASLAADINVFPLFKEKEELIGAAATFRKT
jgi:nitrogen fixation/metabolism regulation signal transduction histidine kinase